eukprot:Gb_33829 [translate_table: standard]
MHALPPHFVLVIVTPFTNSPSLRLRSCYDTTCWDRKHAANIDANVFTQDKHAANIDANVFTHDTSDLRGKTLTERQGNIHGPKETGILIA